MSLVVVTGATGIQGGSVARTLAKDPTWKVRGLTRNPDGDKAKELKDLGIDVVAADLDDATTLPAAFKGAVAIFATTNFWEIAPKHGIEAAEKGEFQQFVNIAHAASDVSSLKHLVLSTMPHCDAISGGELPCPHWDAKAKGTEYVKTKLPKLAAKTTYVWLGWYVDNLASSPLMQPQPYLGKYILAQPSKPDGIVPVAGLVSTNTGVVVQAVLAQPDKTYGKYVPILTDLIPWTKVVDGWNRITGKTAVYAELADPQVETLFGEMGIEIARQFRFNTQRSPESVVTAAAAHGEDMNPTGDDTWALLDAALLGPTTSPGPSHSQTPDDAFHARAPSSKPDEGYVHQAPEQVRRGIGSPQPPRQTSDIKPVLPPQNLINHLVDVYFDFLHPQIRLLHRPTFVPWVQSRAFVSDRDSTLLLSAIFALAARYSDQPEVDLFDRSLSSETENQDGRSVTEKHVCIKRWERGKGFLCQARGLFDGGINEIEKLELESRWLPKPSVRFVQAAALIGYAEIGLAASGRAYSSISTAVRLAYDFGLDRVDFCDTGRAENVGVGAEEDPTAEFVRKEELRRAWWAISDMENFICTTRGRPRMIDYDDCKTKLPCDDRDWFEGRESPSYFLPANLSDLRESPDLPSHISATAHRILATHLMAKFVPLAANKGDLAATGDLLLTVEDIFLLSSKIRTFKNATPSTISLYCRDISIAPSGWEHPSGSGMMISPECQAFAEAHRASDAVCSIIRDWPTHSIARSAPFIAGALWAPACIQLLVKALAGANSGLAEKASLSLRILTMAMEQFAQFWGLGHYLLDCFRRYERKLTDTDWEDKGQGEWNLRWKVVTLPDYIDASFLKAASPGCGTDAEAALSSEDRLEQDLDSTAACANAYAMENLWSFYSDGIGLDDCMMGDLGWMGVEGADELLF
ncbi:uncharacterized protein DNG_09287 [Cephalotrichum gorgonifer]|uniref:Xylanolytic transcriptional activator regulatory domain-containing protein n=1 Tax=Cephalotrichum gorgonifer TaxID=2041049 RepID=A0AAE8N805_9PEZI|nr:uncharacterized protein DNG_09287 [Cephalotrichum gorgonifer]